PSGLFDTHDRQVRWIQQPHLHKQRGLVPPDVLMRNFPILEFHDNDVWKFDFFPRWRNPWQQVIPLCVVSEAHNEFVHHLVFANGAGDGCHLRIFGDLVYKVLAVKATDFPATEAPRESSDAVHIRLGHHGFHRGVNIKIGKLSRDVSIEERAQIGRFRGVGGGYRHFSLVRIQGFHNSVLLFIYVTFELHSIGWKTRAYDVPDPPNFHAYSFKCCSTTRGGQLLRWIIESRAGKKVAA